MAKAHMRGCAISKHLHAAFLGKVNLKYTPSSSPASLTGLSSTQQTRPLSQTSDQIDCTQNADREVGSLNLRLRMPRNRRLKLAADGHLIPSGPLYRGGVQRPLHSS
eukprot:5939536-Karenia_brevis.AAC.1